MRIEEAACEATEGVSSDPRGSPCHVCGDIATGRHYGAIACNGCKGFFRRTVRRGYKYECRFESNCDISKHNRAVCRYCRYMLCVKAGMREEQVQNERDVIGKRVRAASTTCTNGNPLKRHQSFDDGASKRSSPELPPEVLPDDPWEHPDGIIQELLKSEQTIHNLRETVIQQTGNFEYNVKPEEQIPTTPGTRIATINDVFKSLHSQLLLVIEWAKTLPPFTALSTDDQTVLLKNFASQHIVLCVAYRSKEAADVLKLLNGCFLPRPTKHKLESTCGYLLKDCERVIDQLVTPMRFLKMDDQEFVALKACILFNPVARGLSQEAAMPVLQIRRKIFGALEHYVAKEKINEKSRIGDLTFFVLSPLASLANSVAEDILVTKLTGVARLDVLMEELMLADPDTKPNIAGIQEQMELTSMEPTYNNYERPQTSSYDALELNDDLEMDTFQEFSTHMMQPFDTSRSNSPVLGVMGAGHLMWSNPLGGSPSYLPGADTFF